MAGLLFRKEILSNNLGLLVTHGCDNLPQQFLDAAAGVALEIFAWTWEGSGL